MQSEKARSKDEVLDLAAEFDNQIFELVMETFSSKEEIEWAIEYFGQCTMADCLRGCWMIRERTDALLGYNQ